MAIEPKMLGTVIDNGLPRESRDMHGLSPSDFNCSKEWFHAFTS